MLLLLLLGYYYNYYFIIVPSYYENSTHFPLILIHEFKHINKDTNAETKLWDLCLSLSLSGRQSLPLWLSVPSGVHLSPLVG